MLDARFVVGRNESLPNIHHILICIISGGSRIPQRWDLQFDNLANFPQKAHGNEDKRGSATDYVENFVYSFCSVESTKHLANCI